MGRHFIPGERPISFSRLSRGEHPSTDECAGWLRETWPQPKHDEHRIRWSWDDERETLRRLHILKGVDAIRAYVDAQRERQGDFDGEPGTARWRLRLAGLVDDVLVGRS